MVGEAEVEVKEDEIRVEEDKVEVHKDTVVHEAKVKKDNTVMHKGKIGENENMEIFHMTQPLPMEVPLWLLLLQGLQKIVQLLQKLGLHQLLYL